MRRTTIAKIVVGALAGMCIGRVGIAQADFWTQVHASECDYRTDLIRDETGANGGYYNPYQTFIRTFCAFPDELQWSPTYSQHRSATQIAVFAIDCNPYTEVSGVACVYNTVGNAVACSTPNGTGLSSTPGYTSFNVLPNAWIVSADVFWLAEVHVDVGGWGAEGGNPGGSVCSAHHLGQNGMSGWNAFRGYYVYGTSP
jgi:hypothetical protein